MITEDPLISRLANANPAPRAEQLISAESAEASRVLHRVIESVDQASAPRRRRVPKLGDALTGLAVVLATAAVIVGAALTGRPHRVGEGQIAVPAQARDLVSILAVLRRPQSRIARAFDMTAGESTQPGAAGRFIEPGLTQIAQTEPDGSRVVLVVHQPQPGTDPFGVSFASDQVQALLIRADGQPPVLATGALATAEQIKTGHVGLTYCFACRNGAEEKLLIVPDGVAFVRVQLIPTRHVQNVSRGRSRTLVVSVKGNVVALAIPPATRTSVTGWLGPEHQPLAIASHSAG